MDRDCPKSDKTISEFGIFFLRIILVSAESTFQEGAEENGALIVVVKSFPTCSEE